MAYADAEMVRRCIAALGNKAGVGDMVTWIKKNEGKELSPRIVGLHRHHILRVKKGGSKRTVRIEKTVDEATQTPTNGDTVAMKDLTALRGLLKTYGKGRVTDLVSLVS